LNPSPGSVRLLPEKPSIPHELAARLQADYNRFAAGGMPAQVEEYLLEQFDIDVGAVYAGKALRNPWGKASGQLSMTAGQVAEDVSAGLGFVVLKTVIAQDEAGDRSMREARMVAEPIRGRSGESGWTISWKGRGWWQSFDDYLQLVREAREITADHDTLIVPSCKYHLPGPGETEWRVAEYDYTTRRLLEAWRAGNPADPSAMPLEKDFSPTLAGSDRSSAAARILEWLQTAPNLIRRAVTPNGALEATTPRAVLVGMKLFNALFDDAFQLDMLRTIHEKGASRPDFFVYGNRLFDPDREFDGHRGIAYGGPDLSDRNLRVMSLFEERVRSGALALVPLDWSATGNIQSGRMALEYALRGATSFQMHTYFQLPADQYTMKSGSRTQRALHELYFHPDRGLVAWMHHVARTLGIEDRPVRFRDLVARQRAFPVGAPERG
jgi:hypothetical protein